MRRKITAVAAGILLPLCGLFASGTAEQSTIVATTSWTAAFARAAGADSVHVLAPYDLKHPPEYELKPSDLTVVRNARIIIFAGYERMVSRVKESADDSEAQLLQITTQNDLSTIETSVRKIAEVLGTETAAEKNLLRIRDFFESWKNEIRSQGVYGTPVIAHVFQKPLAESLGFTVAGTFGPAPLEATAIRELSRLNAVLILDNFHNPVAAPLKETLPDAAYIRLINFPLSREMPGLLDILEENRGRAQSLYR